MGDFGRFPPFRGETSGIGRRGVSTEAAVQHSGCYLCKTTDIPVLVSIPTPPVVARQAQGLYSIAVCPACAKQQGR